MNRVVLIKEGARQKKIFSFCRFSGCFQNGRLTPVSSVLPSVCFLVHWCLQVGHCVEHLCNDLAFPLASFPLFQVGQPWEGTLWPSCWVPSASIMCCTVYCGERMTMGKSYFCCLKMTPQLVFHMNTQMVLEGPITKHTNKPCNILSLF